MFLLASSVCGSFKWRQFEPEVILLAVGGTCAFLFRTATSRSCSPSGACAPIPSPSRGGFSAMARKWNRLLIKFNSFAESPNLVQQTGFCSPSI